MNTPLGVQGKEHQRRRDALAHSLAKRYGSSFCSPDLSKKIDEEVKIREARAFIERRSRGAARAKELLIAGGHADQGGKSTRCNW